MLMLVQALTLGEDGGKAVLPEGSPQGSPGGLQPAGPPAKS